MIPIIGTAETPAELVALLHAAHRRDQVTAECAALAPETRFRPSADGAKLTQPRRNRSRGGFRCRRRSNSATMEE
jgi:hypothetical protein